MYLTTQKSFPPWKLCHNSPNPSFRTSPPTAGEIRNPVKVQYNQVLSGSRLASRFAGLGRDDELRRSRSKICNPQCSITPDARALTTHFENKPLDGPKNPKYLHFLPHYVKKIIDSSLDLE